jgi:hypothetical protein
MPQGKDKNDKENSSKKKLTNTTDGITRTLRKCGYQYERIGNRNIPCRYDSCKRRISSRAGQ